MNNDLVKSLEKESDENLFFYFKEDGALDFNKKLVAGRLLYDRKYNKKVLQSEKAKIVNGLKATIAEYKNSDALTEKKNKEARKGILQLVAQLAVLSILYVLDYTFFNEDLAVDTTKLMLVGGAGVILIIYKAFRFDKQVRKLVEEAKHDLSIQEQKLSLINKEWLF